MFYFVFLTIVLFSFWLLLSGFWDNTLLLILGILCSLLASLMGLKIKQQDEFDLDLGFFLRFPKYIMWLSGQILLANIDTAKHIWMPKKYPITPTIRELEMSQSTSFGQTIYANSITITPGTVSMDIIDNHVVVHALSHASIVDLQQGGMDRKVTELVTRQ